MQVNDEKEIGRELTAEEKGDILKKFPHCSLCGFPERDGHKNMCPNTEPKQRLLMEAL